MRWWVVLIVLCLILTGCSTPRSGGKGCALIPNPDPPERFDWKQDGAPEKPGTIYLDPYKRLKGAETWTAPEDGGVCLTPKAWRGLRHAVTEWPKWGDMVRGFIQTHNDSVKGQAPESKESWWSRMWGKK